MKNDSDTIKLLAKSDTTWFLFIPESRRSMEKWQYLNFVFDFDCLISNYFFELFVFILGFSHEHWKEGQGRL